MSYFLEMAKASALLESHNLLVRNATALDDWCDDDLAGAEAAAEAELIRLSAQVAA